MPDSRGKMLPNELLPLLKDPSITNWLRSYLLSVTSSESIGRYPGNGSAQDDQYVYPDNADASFAYNFDYVIPSNFQRLVSAKLSFKIRAFRSYNQFSATSTSAETTDHFHPSAAHSHTIPIDAGPFTNATGRSAAGGHFQDAFGPDTAPTNSTTPANTGGRTAVHVHAVSTSSTLGVFEDVAPSNPGLTVKIDGVDQTANVVPAGPFNSDMVEVDVTKVLKTGIKAWHTLSLQPNQRVRITGILRLAYYVDSRLAQ